MASPWRRPQQTKQAHSQPGSPCERRARFCRPLLEALEPRRLLSGASPDKTQIAEAYGQLPLSFEANQGQTDAQVRFLSHGDGYALFLTPTQAVLSLSKPAAPSSDGQPPAAPAEATALFMQVVGANPAAPVTGKDPLAGTSNYLIGNDPSQWQTAIPTYSRVAYQGVYPGIDLVYYGNQRQLEYDLSLALGPTRARFSWPSRGRTAWRWMRKATWYCTRRGAMSWSTPPWCTRRPRVPSGPFRAGMSSKRPTGSALWWALTIPAGP